MMPVPTDSVSLSLTGVSKTYDDNAVLHDVDLSISTGAAVSLLGPSGCGKTTLLRCIAGLERPGTGTIMVGQRVLTGPKRMIPPEQRRIGMVFQDWALFPHLNVAANVGYGLEVNGDAREVETVLDMVGLRGLGERMPSTLSGGQQQRVAIARALAPKPDILLLDEPFSNLDAALRTKVRAETRRLLTDLGTTTLFVTHDQGEAFVMGDEVAVMTDGVIRQRATPAALYDSPVDPWVASFVGEANLIPATGINGVAATPIGDIPVARHVAGSCRVLVRPEQLRLVPGGEALVSDVEFYGHDCSYLVALHGTEVRVRAMSGPRFGVGDQVSVRFEGPPVVVYHTEDPVPVS